MPLHLVIIPLPKWFHTLTGRRIPRTWKAGVPCVPVTSIQTLSDKFYQKNLPWLVVALMVMAMLGYLLKCGMPGADSPNPVLTRQQNLHSNFTSLADMASAEMHFNDLLVQQLVFCSVKNACHYGAAIWPRFVSARLYVSAAVMNP